MAGTTLRIMLWNIHGGVGLDGRHDLNRIASAIMRLKPDIMALQEVGSHRRAQDGDLAFRVFRDCVGRSVEARSISTRDGQFGQLVASKWRIRRSRVHDISISGREPRRVIDCIINAGDCPVRIIATHLGLHLDERRKQARELGRILDLVNSDMPTIVLGDFNDWRMVGPVAATMRNRMAGGTRHRTFPSWMPAFPLDRIWWSGGVELKESWVDREARQASDHLPVLATVRLEAAEMTLRQPPLLAVAQS